MNNVTPIGEARSRRRTPGPPDRRKRPAQAWRWVHYGLQELRFFAGMAWTVLRGRRNPEGRKP